MPKVGDTISAFVRTDNGSEILLTRTLRRNEVDDSLLRNAFEAKIPVEAKVEKVIKGGFEATVGAKRCFVPLGQMDITHFDNPEVYVGNTFNLIRLLPHFPHKSAWVNNPVCMRTVFLVEKKDGCGQQKHKE